MTTFRYAQPHGSAPRIDAAPKARLFPAPAGAAVAELASVPREGARHPPRASVSPHRSLACPCRGQHVAAFVETGGGDIRPLGGNGADPTAFVANMLRTAAPHQALGIVTNARDFMHLLRFGVERLQLAGRP